MFYRGNTVLQREIEIINRLGLHARASSKLTQTACQFGAEVWISRNDRRVNAKGMMGGMKLAAGKGSMIKLETDGPDEEQAMAALVNLINDKFGEGE